MCLQFVCTMGVGEIQHLHTCGRENGGTNPFFQWIGSQRLSLTRLVIAGMAVHPPRCSTPCSANTWSSLFQLQTKYSISIPSLHISSAPVLETLKNSAGVFPWHFAVHHGSFFYLKKIYFLQKLSYLLSSLCEEENYFLFVNGFIKRSCIGQRLWSLQRWQHFACFCK